MIVLQLYMAFLKIGMFSLGGGYVMLPLIQKEIIENYGWLTQTEFVDIIAIAEMTPGPVAINSATFIGFRTAGIWGAVLATAGVVTFSGAQAGPIGAIYDVQAYGYCPVNAEGEVYDRFRYTYVPPAPEG